MSDGLRKDHEDVRARATGQTAKASAFYDKCYASGVYGARGNAKSHPFYPVLKQAIDNYTLEKRRCIEIGCGRGIFQDMVTDYTGVDITQSVSERLLKTFFVASATALPFEANTTTKSDDSAPISLMTPTASMRTRHSGRIRRR